MQLVDRREAVRRARSRARAGRARRRAGTRSRGRAASITWCIGHLVELEEPAAYDAALEAVAARHAADDSGRASSCGRCRARATSCRGRRELLRDRRFTEVVNACDAGPRGRADLSLRLRAGRQPAAGAAAVDLVADRRGHPPGLRGAAAGRRVRAAGRRGPLALRGRLAGRHERHRARSTRARTATGDPDVDALLLDRPGADADAGHARRSASRRSARSCRATTGRCAGTLRVDRRRARRSPRCGRRRARTGHAPRRRGARRRRSSRATRAHAAAADPLGPRRRAASSRRRSREPPPLLFDLTSLQRTANRRFGFSAPRTLEIAQALYETPQGPDLSAHRLAPPVADLAGELPQAVPRHRRRSPTYAASRRRSSTPPAPAAQLAPIFDDAKVHDHHAIIPTGKVRRDGRWTATSSGSSIWWCGGSWARSTPTPSSPSPRRGPGRRAASAGAASADARAKPRRGDATTAR